MSSIPETSVTHVSLLGKLRDDDHDPVAWRVFVDRYGQRIYEWSVARGLQAADAEDVTQEVLLKLARHLGTFQYDPKLTFRGWLRRITENAVSDFLRTQKIKGGRNAQSCDALQNVEAQADLAKRMEDAYDLELLDVAKTHVRARVESHRWRAWELVAVHGQSGEDVAKRLSMKVPTVHSSRYQVQKMITGELKRLEAETDQTLLSRNSATSTKEIV